MAELLIRVMDKAKTTKHNGRYHTKAGDVIVVKPDGHRWGRKEVIDPYRVFQLPDYPAWMFSDVYDAAETHWGRVVQKSMRYFDVGRTWVRSLILSGGVIRLNREQAKRFLKERSVRPRATTILVA